MTTPARSAATTHTTRAIGPNGRTIHFDDLVRDGDIVEVGGRRMRVYYDPQAPDWFVEDERWALALAICPEIREELELR